MSINLSETIWTVICFLVLLIVLKKLLFDPLLRHMDARSARIASAQEALDRAENELRSAAEAKEEALRARSAADEAALRQAQAALDTRLAEDKETARHEAAAQLQEAQARFASAEPQDGFAETAEALGRELADQWLDRR